MAAETAEDGNQALGRMAALNEELMLGLVRQHELTEIAELLNVQLKAEIVARKKAEEALVRSEKLASVGRMAAVLAHEINNPLDAAMNIIYLARTGEDLSASLREYLEAADGQLKRIAHITRQTLGFYREQSMPAEFSVPALLATVLDLLQAKKISKQAIIRTQCNPNLRMTAFEGELRQVLSNLLMNSLDAIAEGGTVSIKVKALGKVDHSMLRFAVSDNGHGMSDMVVSHLFQPFFSTKGDVGNGLGLWVSKQIIDKHNGVIKTRSRLSGPYRGSTFSLVVPISHPVRIRLPSLV